MTDGAPRSTHTTDEMNMAVFAHRLGVLESKVDSGFQSVNDTIIATSATFLRLDLYLSERDAQNKEIEQARKIAWWAMGLICATVMSAILIGVLGAAGVR